MDGFVGGWYGWVGEKGRRGGGNEGRKKRMVGLGLWDEDEICKRVRRDLRRSMGEMVCGR